MFAPAAAIIAQRFIGGAAALMAAVIKIAAVLFVSLTPITASTVPTKPPTVSTVVAPEPVRAPGISMTKVSSNRHIIRRSLNVATIFLTINATPPDSLTSVIKNVAVIKIRQTSK